MAKRIVFTMNVLIDTKTEDYTTKIKGNGGMPSEDLVAILDLISGSIKEKGCKTMGEFFTPKDINNG